VSSFHAVAIPTEVADSVRVKMKSPKYGFPAHKEVAAGRAPCRHCLQLVKVHEEEAILFTMDAFHGQDVPPSPGPVYIHAKECTRYGGSQGIPEVYRGRLLTLEAFGEDRKLVAEIRTTHGEEDSVAKMLLARQDVEYVHVRSTEAGCYLFRLERS